MAPTLVPGSARREVRQAFFIVMETAWMAAVAAFIDGLIDGPARMAAAWAVGLYPATYAFARFERHWPARAATRIAVRASLAVLAVGIPVGILAAGNLARLFTGAAFDPTAAWPTGVASVPLAAIILAAVVGLFSMARGWLLAPSRIDAEGFLAGFQFGIGVLFAVVFARHLAGHPIVGTMAAVVAFLAFGLYGLWLARWLDAAGAARSAGRAGWPVFAAAVVGLVLAAGALLWLTVDRDVILQMLQPVIWLWEMIGRLFDFLIGLLPSPEPRSLPATPTEIAPRPVVREKVLDLGETVRAIGKMLFMLGVVGLVLLALMRNLSDLLRWLARWSGRSEGIDFAPSSFGLWNDLRDIARAFAALMRHLWHRILRLLGRRRHALPAQVRTVRRLYAGLLAWAAKRGLPRRIDQTPYEFLGVLRRALPHLEAELTGLTEAYVAVRYGARIPAAETVRDLDADWRRIRKARRR